MMSGQIAIDQELYIGDILKRFKMDDCNPVSTPLVIGENITKEMEPPTDEEKREMDRIPYRAAIGSLLFLAFTTRPDMATVDLMRINKLLRICELN